MTFDPTKPVQTRAGKPVRILCTDRKGSYPIVGLICDHAIDHEEMESWRLSGAYSYGPQKCPLDLINVPERTERFMNVYVAGFSSVQHRNLKEAKESARLFGKKSHGQVRLTFEDGVLISAEKV